jgi:hypothetical protein
LLTLFHGGLHLSARASDCPGIINHQATTGAQ